MNTITNNSISFGAYNLKPSYDFSGIGDENDRGLLVDKNHIILKYDDDADFNVTSNFIDFVNFGFRLKKLPENEHLFIPEYLINSNSLPITISSGGIKTNSDSNFEPTDLTFKGNRIIFEAYKGNSGYYLDEEKRFTNNENLIESNKILFLSPVNFKEDISFINHYYNETEDIDVPVVFSVNSYKPADISSETSAIPSSFNINIPLKCSLAIGNKSYNGVDDIPQIPSNAPGYLPGLKAFATMKPDGLGYDNKMKYKCINNFNIGIENIDKNLFYISSSKLDFNKCVITANIIDFSLGEYSPFNSVIRIIEIGTNSFKIEILKNIRFYRQFIFI